jgi:hypothetical protein
MATLFYWDIKAVCVQYTPSENNKTPTAIISRWIYEELLKEEVPGSTIIAFWKVKSLKS